LKERVSEKEKEVAKFDP